MGGTNTSQRQDQLTPEITRWQRANAGTLTNRNLGNTAASEPSSPTSASPDYAKTPEKQDLDLKSLFMMLLEEHKKDINESRKEIQGNMNKLETRLMETQNHLWKFRRLRLKR